MSDPISFIHDVHTSLDSNKVSDGQKVKIILANWAFWGGVITCIIGVAGLIHGGGHDPQVVKHAIEADVGGAVALVSLIALLRFKDQAAVQRKALQPEQVFLAQLLGPGIDMPRDQSTGVQF